MLEKDDEAAREARAADLIAEIDRWSSQQSQPEKKERENKDDPASAKEGEKKHTPESPRDFIQRRMRELDNQKERESQD
jgi:hypothetical protein